MSYMHITIDGEHVNVPKTPSHITYICMVTPKGWTIHMKGKNAKRAVRAYLAWMNYADPKFDASVLMDALNTDKEFEVYAG